jgi:hypothetical protein
MKLTKIMLILQLGLLAFFSACQESNKAEENMLIPWTKMLPYQFKYLPFASSNEQIAGGATWHDYSLENYLMVSRAVYGDDGELAARVRTFSLKMEGEEFEKSTDLRLDHSSSGGSLSFDPGSLTVRDADLDGVAEAYMRFAVSRDGDRYAWHYVCVTEGSTIQIVKSESSKPMEQKIEGSGINDQIIQHARNIWGL